jgi:SP family myo-inositol transporter-like MFS transporter 13
MLGIAAVPSIIQFIGMLFMPETPVFLYKQDKVEEADQVLANLYIPSVVINKKRELQEEVENIKLEGRDPFLMRIK